MTRFVNNVIVHNYREFSSAAWKQARKYNDHPIWKLNNVQQERITRNLWNALNHCELTIIGDDAIVRRKLVELGVPGLEALPVFAEGGGNALINATDTHIWVTGYWANLPKPEDNGYVACTLDRKKTADFTNRDSKKLTDIVSAILYMLGFDGKKMMESNEGKFLPPARFN